MAGLNEPVEAIQVEAPWHGLLTSAEDASGRDRWEVGGIKTRPEYCSTGGSWNPLCSTWDGATAITGYETPEAPDWEDANPTLIWTAFTCNSIGGPAVIQQYRDKAMKQLEVGSGKLAEYEFWTGHNYPADADPDTPQTPNLQTGATLVTGGALTTARALARAGKVLADCSLGAQGMIHADSEVGALWTEDGQLVEDQQGRLRTKSRGDIVVIGAGYPGTGINGVAPGANQSYIFITGPVQYRLGPIEVYQQSWVDALDRRTNMVEYRAFRNALFNFDACCHYAILVDLATGN